MSIPGIDWGWLAPGADGMVIPGIDDAGSAGWGLPISIPGIEPETGGFVLLLGAGLGALRVGFGFALAVEVLAFAAGFLAGIGMFMPGMLCIDCASAGGEVSAIAVLAASAASRIMPPLPSVAR